MIQFCTTKPFMFNVLYYLDYALASANCLLSLKSTNYVLPKLSFLDVFSTMLLFKQLQLGNTYCNTFT